MINFLWDQTSVQHLSHNCERKAQFSLEEAMNDHWGKEV